jgi:hypothetical protein
MRTFRRYPAVVSRPRGRHERDGKRPESLSEERRSAPQTDLEFRWRVIDGRWGTYAREVGLRWLDLADRRPSQFSEGGGRARSWLLAVAVGAGVLVVHGAMPLLAYVLLIYRYTRR